MSDLISRLEQAEAGSRELDFEIGQIAIGLRHVDGDLYDTSDPAGPYYSESGEYHRAFPRYTTSIDAAMTLAKGDGEAIQMLLEAINDNCKDEWLKALPRFLCIAALKASHDRP